MPTELFDQAVFHHRGGNLAHAEALYRQVLQLEPGHFHAHHLLGLIAHQAGRYLDAITLIRQAIALNPSAPVFHANLGVVLKDNGQLAEAAQSLRHALTLNPAYADGYNNLGNVLMKQGLVAEAAECYHQALGIDPLHGQALCNLGNAFMEKRQPAQAAACYREALRINPRLPKVHNNLGDALKTQGHFAEAAECYRQELCIDPQHVDAHLNLGTLLAQLGDVEEATACYQRLLSFLPGNPAARWNLAVLRLQKGDFVNAWPDYEYRWQVSGFAKRHTDKPLWTGAPFDSKTILLYAEQGMGDTIQFIRYANLVKRRGGTVAFECHSALIPLLKNVAGIDHFMASDAPPSLAFDLQAPLLSVPGILRTTLTSVPAAVPYITADAGLMENWRTVLQPLHGLKVGIAWQGSSRHPDDRLRSVPLAHFESIARIEGVRLVSLQVGSGTDQIGPLADRVALLDVSDRLNGVAAFPDTAAVMMNLDLVITVDTAVAHLAGALGVPVWLLLARNADWRWLVDREDSPWYPTMRLFRQRQPGDWREVFERVGEALGHRMRTDRKGNGRADLLTIDR